MIKRKTNFFQIIFNEMRIRKPRGLTTTQLMVTTVVGVLGGVYIYKPLFLETKVPTLHNDNKEPAKTNTLTEKINRTVSSDKTSAVAK